MSHRDAVVGVVKRDLNVGRHNGHPEALALQRREHEKKGKGGCGGGGEGVSANTRIMCAEVPQSTGKGSGQGYVGP